MIKFLLKSRLILLAGIIGVLCTPVICYGEEIKAEEAPVYGTDLEDGSYEAQVESSSSMFRIVKANLNVKDGVMTADITLGGTGYLKLFMGTGEEALKAQEENYIPYVEDEKGAYTYTIPIEALNVKFPCAAYSKRKETWYDRELVIWYSSLQGDNLKQEPVQIEKDSGDYTMEVSLKGGTGKAAIVSPAHVRVKEGEASIFIQWSSPNFDYMIVNGEKYLPVNSGGNSVFEIPVVTLDEEMDIIADTVAMSSPHEIEYTLAFHWDTMKRKADNLVLPAGILVLMVIILACIFRYQRRRGRKEQDV